MKKILITGGNGFIGRNLKEYLAAEYDIVAPSHMELELCDEKEVKEYLLLHKFDVVIHCANTNNTRKKDTADYEILDKNLRMFFNLKRCSDLFGKMYYFGSGAEYDMGNYIPLMKEEYFGNFVPKDPYGFSKYIMSSSINDADNIFDLRLFGVYGKYEEWERRFISNNIYFSLCNQPVSVNQNRMFDFLYIDDLGKIMKWFIENTPSFKHYNVCTGVPISLLEIAETIKKVCKNPFDIIVKMEGMGKEYSGTNKRLLNEIGGFQFTDYSRGIRVLYEFYREGGAFTKI